MAKGDKKAKTKKLADIAPGFGERLQKLREMKGVSQSDLASMVGVSYVYIWMLERGDRQPSQGLITIIAVKSLGQEKYLREATKMREKKKRKESEVVST